jgi:hypothetical protein
MSARRRRVARALLLAYLFRVLGAALLAFPLAAAVGASGIRSFPDGDAKLFERGGLYLLELLTSERALLDELLMPSIVLLLITALAGVVPASILVRALHPRSGEAELPSLGRSIGRAVLVALATGTARALLVLATLGLAMAARSFFVTADDERLPLLAGSLPALLGALGWACLSVLHDVALIAVATEGAAPSTAIAVAIQTLRQSGLRLGALYAATALASLSVIGSCGGLVTLLDVAQGGSWRILAVALIHQLAILGQLVLRAAWLLIVLGTLAPRPERPAQAEAFL